MKVYRFIPYVGTKKQGVYEIELANFQMATLQAEAFLSPDADTFVDSVRFFAYDPDFIRTTVYRLERSTEITDTVML